jgi:hypothetical protein
MARNLAPEIGIFMEGLAVKNRIVDQRSEIKGLFSMFEGPLYQFNRKLMAYNNFLETEGPQNCRYGM